MIDAATSVIALPQAAQKQMPVSNVGPLLRTLVAASSAKMAGFGVPSFVPKWRTAMRGPVTGWLARRNVRVPNRSAVACPTRRMLSRYEQR
jgi:hypothetical protein